MTTLHIFCLIIIPSLLLAPQVCATLASNPSLPPCQCIRPRQSYRSSRRSAPSQHLRSVAYRLPAAARPLLRRVVTFLCHHFSPRCLMLHGYHRCRLQPPSATLLRVCLLPRRSQRLRRHPLKRTTSRGFFVAPTSRAQRLPRPLALVP